MALALDKCLLVSCLFLVSYVHSKPNIKDTKEAFQLDEFLNRQFTPKIWNGTWIQGNSFLYKNENGDTVKYNLSEKIGIPFLGVDILKNYAGGTLKISKDGLYALIVYNVSAVFRHSTTAILAIYDINKQQYYDVANKEPVQYVEWSPTGHGLVYVLRNELFYIDDPVNAEHPKQITNNGVVGIIYNAVPDWVYEEEVLGTGSALWFSPNGRYLAFASFNDTEIPDFLYFIYGQPGSLETQYPLTAALKYPKAGQPNPQVKTYVVDLQESSPTPEEVSVIPEEYLPADYVLFGAVWPSNDEVSFFVTNRVQNKGKLIRYTLNTHLSQVESTYEELNGWLEVKLPKYSKDGKKRLEILPASEGKELYYHILLSDIEKNNTIRLTKGKRVVTEILGWDEINNKIYYKATKENYPSSEHAYVIDTTTCEDKCITCTLATPSGICRVGDIKLSQDFSHYAEICEGRGPDYVELKNAETKETIVVWQDNEELLKKLSKKLQPNIEDFVLPVGDGHEARIRLYLPPEYSISTTSCSKKYPAIVQVYAGPNSNRISDSYAQDIRDYWVTNRKYIYIQIDGRGSGKGSQRKMFEIYRKLGTVEIEDQINVTRYLQENIPCLDANRTGIWGWSYGGFATAWALIKDMDNVFKFGVSVAPVTSWIYYDSIYTERYMGLPKKEDNLEGYNNTDITRRVEDLRGKPFFLIHGNADDNVHYQQSMLLAKALETADIQFRQLSYPDENHSLRHVYPHLYHTLDRYFAQQFGLPPPKLTPIKKAPRKQS